MEGSGHWPEDIDRIRDLKALYLIDLGDKLSDLGLKVNVQETHLDVLKVLERDYLSVAVRNIS